MFVKGLLPIHGCCGLIFETDDVIVLWKTRKDKVNMTIFPFHSTYTGNTDGVIPVMVTLKFQ